MVGLVPEVMETPVPAVRERIPVFPTVTAPVDELTLIPVPAVKDDTPVVVAVELMMGSVDVPPSVMFVPAVMD
jgi:hypothetical protein